MLSIDHRHPSPNHSPRGGAAIALLVWHATVGSATSALNWFANPAARVSAHYVISKAGVVYQCVADADAAWHAGRSGWHGLTSGPIERSSIGIELENANTGRDPYPAAQLRQARELGRLLVARYNIERGDVVRHMDIAVPPGRKTDPAGLPWPAFADSLYMDRPAPPPERHYRVKSAVTSVAFVRSAPRKDAPVIKSLHAGDPWDGLPETGDRVTLPGFGSSDQWICDARLFCVWSGLLEEVT